MQPERADLYFQQGSSDKVYHLQLENVQDQWSVQAQWGRRGSALQSDVKASGTTYEEAKRVYDRILREKTGKGYQIARASANGNEALAVDVAREELARLLSCLLERGQSARCCDDLA